MKPTGGPYRSSQRTLRWREMDSNFQYAGAHRARIYDR